MHPQRLHRQREHSKHFSNYVFGYYDQHSIVIGCTLGAMRESSKTSDKVTQK